MRLVGRGDFLPSSLAFDNHEIGVISKIYFHEFRKLSNCRVCQLNVITKGLKLGLESAFSTFNYDIAIDGKLCF